MPVETLRPSDGHLTGAPFASAMPFRILTKGPDYFRHRAETASRKPSAVERLEADKAKYVKSQQVALTRQAPVKPPIIRKTLVPPAMILQCHASTPPARKSPRSGGVPGGRQGPPLNLDILNNLINGVRYSPLPSSCLSSSTSPSSSSPSLGTKSVGGGSSADHLKTRSAAPSSFCASSLFNPNRQHPPIPARPPHIFVPSADISPNAVMVRRVDVRPHAEIGKPQRPLISSRQSAQGQVVPPPAQLTPQNPPWPQSNRRATPSPPSYLPPSPMLLRTGMIPPASPAFTCLSSASSKGSTRKHPSLHRSKSDLSDRYSRATANLERFFNYCGLDPNEVEGMGGVEHFTRANSDIVSIPKLCSVSTPSSECGDEARASRKDYRDDEEEEEDGPAGGKARVPYSISIIERNARVIKWLYGIRQARDTNNAISNV